MRLMPRSLFVRNMVLLVGLLLFSQLLTISLLHRAIVKPRLGNLAQLVALQIDAVRIPLTSLQAGERGHYLARLNRSRPIRVFRADGPVEASATPPPLIRAIRRRLHHQGDGAQEIVQWRQEDGRLWLRVAFEAGDSYWFVMRSPSLGDDLTVLWGGMSIASLLLAFAGAALIQRFLHRPVRELMGAARQLGEGQLQTRVRTDGPSEIAALAHSFNQMAERLAQTEQERQIMLAGVSHDLRSPLAKLRLGLEIIEAEVDDELRQRMIHNIETMDAVIGQFLDFARADQGEPVQHLDLNTLLEQTAASRDGLRLELTPLPAVGVRPNALNRALANLLDNAERYGAPPLVLSSGVDAEGIHIRIRDHGPGIAEQHRERLLEPFQRGDAARGGAAGAGLGLAIVNRIVALHGGSLHLHSPAGGGLEVEIRLPLPAPDGN